MPTTLADNMSQSKAGPECETPQDAPSPQRSRHCSPTATPNTAQTESVRQRLILLSVSRSGGGTCRRVPIPAVNHTLSESAVSSSAACDCLPLVRAGAGNRQAPTAHDHSIAASPTDNTRSYDKGQVPSEFTALWES